MAPVGELQALVRRALGAHADLQDVQRLRGGTKKGVYRLTLVDGSSVIVYLWSSQENYWPVREGIAEDRDPFSHADGLDLFLGATDALTRAGLRTLLVHLVEKHHPGLGADVAIVQDVPGPTLEEHIAHGDPDQVRVVLERVRHTLGAMAAHTQDGLGKACGPLIRDRSCPEVVVERALADLAEGAERRPVLAQVATRVAERLRTLVGRITPRREYGLVHGELGPDHILGDADDRPVLIDIEGLMYFDLEWEHTFLRLRFGEWYRHLGCPGLDPARIDLYMLAHHLSLVAGPLRLLDGPYPDRAEMQAIVDHHLGCVLAQV